MGVRIGTWNLAGRWTPAHAALLKREGCDVWLLTEVSERLSLPGYEAHVTDGLMAARRRWAGVLARTSVEPLPDPHPASALAQVEGWTFCSSILPWRSAGTRAPWVDGDHARKTAATLAALAAPLSSGGTVWGGDWNHALSGPERAGSIGGRTALLGLIDMLDLMVPTATLAHCIPRLLSIDHIAVPTDLPVSGARRVVARDDADRRLSDHDAYVMTVDL